MARQMHLADSEETLDEENWFQMKRPSLLKQLQNIMREYPDDVQILYELVQNAEDSKATAMKIMFDNRDIDPGGPYGQYLKSPALCVYNNAVFEEEDWDGIASVYLSHKENIAYKIGRYGQGFKSVFHITDFPVIISGNSVLVIDPFKENKECQRTNLTAFEKKIGESGILNSFGLSRKIIREGHFNGTLFWFPLRTSVSSLSRNVYCSSKIEGTLELFKNETHLVLLFLKYLTQIELWDIEGKMLHKTEVTFDDRKTCDSLCSMWETIESGSHNTHSIAFNCTTNIITSPSTQSQNSQPWTVVHFYAGLSQMDKPLTALAIDADIACLPYVGVAFQQGITKSQSGRVFNFLPLPATNKTNLPVHVNANFALSQNRRHLKLSDGKSSDKFVQWNEAVVGKLVPMAYVKLIKHLIEHSIKNGNPENQIKMVYDCMPQHGLFFYDAFWEQCVSGFYNRVLQLPVFFTVRNNGKWVCQDSAILCDITTSDILPVEKENIKETIKTVLLYLDKNVVDLRDSMKMLIKYGHIIDISPHELVKYLKTSRSTSVIRRLSREQKINLLHYIMTDSKVKLDGLELLPLQNDDFENFQENFRGENFTYVSTQTLNSSVFPGLENRFVSNNLEDSLMKKITAIAKKGCFQLRNIEYGNIPQLLDEVFSIHCQYVDNGKFISKQKPSPLDIHWITKIWSNINISYDKDDLQDFENLPLIPQYIPERSQIDSFYLLKGNYVLKGYENAGLRNLPEKVLNILQLHGIQNLDWNTVIESSKIIGKYIKYPVYESIIDLKLNN